MSSLIIEVVSIDKTNPHPNADSLDITTVKGWQVVTRRGQFKPGDKVVYFPPDSILPIELSEKLGVTKYLSKGRVKSVKLRGEPSHGFIVSSSEVLTSDEPIGSNVSEKLGITKWEPPQELSVGDMESPHPLFGKYTDIENIRNFPSVIQDHIDVVVTEKIHGTNSRVGMVEGEWMAGSHNTRKKKPEGDMSNSMYWYPLSLEPVRKMIEDIYSRNGATSVVAYGEIFGWVQDLKYGRSKGEISYAMFDLSIDGKYVDFDIMIHYSREFSVPIVPIIYRGKFIDIKERLKDLSSGKSIVSLSDQIKEGIVIKPTNELTDSKIGRIILKYISDEYLTRKNGTENH